MKNDRNLPESPLDESGGLQIIALRRVIAFMLIYPRVLLSPRRFFTEISIQHRNILAACIYLIGACLLTALSAVSMTIADDLEWARSFLVRSLFGFVSTLACGVLMAILWRPQRLKERVKDFYSIYLYHSGTFNLTLMLLTASYPESAAVLVKACSKLTPEFKDSPNFALCSIAPILDGLLFQYVVFAIVGLVMFVWGVVAWRAYVDMISVKCWKAVVYFLLFILGSVVIGLYFGIPIVAVQIDVLAEILTNK